MIELNEGERFMRNDRGLVCDFKQLLWSFSFLNALLLRNIQYIWITAS